MSRRGQSSRGGGQGDIPWLTFQQITSRSSQARAKNRLEALKQKEIHLPNAINWDCYSRFFATISFRGGSEYYNPNIISFSLGGELRQCSIAELAWRIGIYDQNVILTEDFETFLEQCHKDLPEEVFASTWWNTIANRVYIPSSSQEGHIRSPIHRLIQRLIASTINMRKDDDKNRKIIWVLDLQEARALTVISPPPFSTTLYRRARIVENFVDSYAIPHEDEVVVPERPGRRVRQRNERAREDPPVIPVEDENEGWNQVEYRRYLDDIARGVNYNNESFNYLFQLMNIAPRPGPGYPYIMSLEERMPDPKAQFPFQDKFPILHLSPPQL
uniref:Uncharacterized protein n=1 Tax=Lactuca sativa TaxID=4236 RepID=A0A9R1UFC0_LACSA|nr:hypothetical protein LSAT_V11C900488620 [Lactuca sativa]